MKLSAALLFGIFAVVDSKNVRRRHVKDAHLLKLVENENNLNSEPTTKSTATSQSVHRSRDLQTAGSNCQVIDQSNTGTASQLLAGALPVQTYFVPLPEEKLFTHGFYQINPSKARPPIESLISVSVSTDKTVIWYDHWEDSYDTDGVISPTTEIWGDGNADNGCAPGVDPCTHATDRLNAGSVVVIQNSIPLPRDKTQLRYDGADRILASYPIAVTRGAYPAQPGSLMAGAVEVLAQSEWGLTYEAPVGIDVGQVFEAFQYSAFYFMAGEDNTIVTLPNSNTIRLNMGQSTMIFVNQSDRVQSNKPIQVDLITGDVWSYYEMRWYSMLSVEKYTASYVSPVGDSIGKTKVLVYNPNDEAISVTLQYLKTYSNGYIQRMQYAIHVAPKQYQLSQVIPTFSGAFLDGTGPFLALSLTDTEETAGNGQTTGGQWYDWGFPVMPREKLTSQVLVGWGYGCTDKKCYGQVDRSVVWVTPVEDADIYVDFGNTGIPDGKVSLRALQGIRIGDPGDDDMSGAIVYATKPRTGPSGPGVEIAAAWGQDPSVSYQYQGISLDLGTVVLPLSTVQVAKLVNKEVVSAGEELQYTIRVSNVGQSLVKAGDLIVKDALDEHVTYVPGSMRYQFEGSGCTISDDSTGTAYPLDGAGYVIPMDLRRRGGFVDLVFKVVVSKSALNELIVNNGHVEQTGTVIPFTVSAKLAMEASISIANTVYAGLDNGQQCDGDKPTEYVGLLYGSNVTYCLIVQNTGTTFLNNITLVDEALHFSELLDVTLAPGERHILHLERPLLQSLENTAVVKGNPILSDGRDIQEIDIVQDSDPSAVGRIAHTAVVHLANTVAVGAEIDCSLSSELAVDLLHTDVRYCFLVTNTGNSFLTEIQLQDPILQYSNSFGGVLAPGESKLFTLNSSIESDIINVAIVTAVPSLANGTAIPDMNAVTDKDTSETRKLIVASSVSIENTVYLSHDGDSGDKCDTTEAVEFVAGIYGDSVTYCLRVVNTGASHLSDVEVVDPNLAVVDNSIGGLGPGEAKTIHAVRSIAGNLTNVATVTAIPRLADGRAIPGTSEVTDSDPSEVSQRLRDAYIQLDNKVYSGTNGGNSCGTVHAQEHVEDFMNKPVTYCFTVKNVGDTYLNATVKNDDLGFSRSLGLVAPGVSESVYLESVITGVLTNTATVTGKPVLSNGTLIPNHSDVKSSDGSSVSLLAYAPKVSIQNTVYLGDDTGALCNTTTPKEIVEATFGSFATYCFLVTNQGNTFLTDAKLQNTELSLDSALPTLAPGQSTVVAHSSQILGDLVNNCTVIASPSHPDGSLLPINFVRDSDTSRVVRIPVHPSISIETRVHLSDKAGSSCDGASDYAADIYLENIEWCFVVKNTGDTYLDSVMVEAVGIDFRQSLDRILGPQELIVLRSPGKIISSMDNEVSVSANPVLADRTDILDVADVSALDSASIRKLEFPADITLTSWVAYGDNANACDDDERLPTIQAKFGDLVTYCFNVENTGESHLTGITIVDKAIPYFNTTDWNLQPGESRRVSVVSLVKSDLSNETKVTATASLADGRLLLDVDEVFDSDNTSVVVIPFEPRIVVETSVYEGTHDDGALCAEAVEEVEGTRETNITYCVVIENKGDVYLNHIKVSVEAISYETLLAEGLAPNASIVVPVPSIIIGDVVAVARVSAKPTLSDQSEIPHLEDVSDFDAATVNMVAHEPHISIINTVYLNPGAEMKCGTNETHKTVEGYQGTAITYCFEVVNSGDSLLKNIALTNTELSFSDVVQTLSPGESKMIVHNSTIESSVSNIIEASAIPSQNSGEEIPGSVTVHASDSSSVTAKEYAPLLAVDNVVYKGHNGIEMCNTTHAREVVEDFVGSAVTYCFVVKNDGDTALKIARVSNDALGYGNDVDEYLEVGETMTLTLEKAIDVDLINFVVVYALAVKPHSHEVLRTLPPLHASDSSAVEVTPIVAGLKVDHKAYVGDGDHCGTDQALAVVKGFFGSAVTYCMEVKNTGDTFLSDILLENEALSFTKSDFGVLPPGASLFVVFPTTFDTGANVFTAKVKATPVSNDGLPLPGMENISSEAFCTTLERIPIAKIRIENTVYDGEKIVNGCQNANNSTSGLYGSSVTYCMKVTNEGATYLNNVEIVDDELNLLDSSILMLRPQESVTIQVAGSIESDLRNEATVTGNPCLQDGTDIPSMDDVSNADDSFTNMIAHAPSIELSNKVYLGDDSGESCDTDLPTEYVEGGHLTIVTYCFKITNTGNSFLDDISLVDDVLGFADNEIDRLAPGASTMLAYAGPIEGSFTNTAVVTANPVLENGNDIPGVANVETSDTSLVGQLSFEASISIKNTVYIGSDLGNSCGTATAMKSTTGEIGDDIVYCFLVKNTGNTFLGQVVLENPALAYKDNSIGTLGPNESTMIPYQGILSESFANVASVSALPILSNGQAIAEATTVTAADDSEAWVLADIMDGRPKNGDKLPYTAVTDEGKCLEDTWKLNSNDRLLCATKEVYLESVSARSTSTCQAGQTITVTIDGSIRFDSGPRYDIGWYVATDGGDAMEGRCAVNGFQESNTYGITNGSIAWSGSDSDGDMCGDVSTEDNGTGSVDTPIAMSLSMPCVDTNDDGILDFAVCFTWHNDSSDSTCDFLNNVPEVADGGCFCSRYEVSNVQVIAPVHDDVTACK